MKILITGKGGWFPGILSQNDTVYHPPLKMYFRGGRGQVKKIHLPFSKNLIPQDPP
jgi:hypothetical protein